jgi:hypothetical protein
MSKVSSALQSLKSMVNKIRDVLPTVEQLQATEL